ncbi:MAG: O-antigen ligase family protein [Alphaproteobacteria bacterium]|nr:O-antigen ligase family protein [Alphaproteobacteria bacterium]
MPTRTRDPAPGAMSVASPRVVAPAGELGGGSYLLTLAAFFMGPLGALAPLALAPLFVVTALALAWRRYRIAGGQELWRQTTQGRIPTTLFLLALVAAASVVWSIDPAVSAAAAARLLAGIAGGVLLAREVQQLSPAERRPFAVGLVAGCVVLLVVLALEAQSDAAIHRAIQNWTGSQSIAGVSAINRQASVVALLAWPAALALWQGGYRSGALGLLAMTAMVLFQLASGAAVAGFIGGLVVAPVVWLLPRVVPWLLAAVIAGGALATPVLPLTLLAPETLVPRVHPTYAPAIHRLYIWRFVAEQVWERPLLGYGIESSRRFPGASRHVLDVYPEAPGIVRTEGVLPILPLHPHNAALQVWLELGLGGALAFAALVALVLSSAARRDRPPAVAAGLAGATITGIAIALFAYGIWQGWWIAALFLTAAWMIGAAALPTAAPRREKQA